MIHDQLNSQRHAYVTQMQGYSKNRFNGGKCLILVILSDSGLSDYLFNIIIYWEYLIIQYRVLYFAHKRFDCWDR